MYSKLELQEYFLYYLWSKFPHCFMKHILQLSKIKDRIIIRISETEINS